MADQVDFASLGNVSAADVKPPQQLPTGHYQAMIVGPMSEHRAKSGNAAMRFPIRLTEAGDDVDQEILAEAGGLPDRNFNLDFWMSADAQYRFTNFCQSVEIDLSNLTLIEAAERLAEESPTFTIELSHEQDQKDPERVYQRLDNPVGNAGN